MNSCHNFAFLSPLKALDDFNSGNFYGNQSSIETIWLILSQLDVNSIQDEELEKTSSFWCASVISAKISNFAKKPKTTSHLFFAYCLIPQVSYSLYQRLLKKSQISQNDYLKDHLYDPIFAVYGFLDNIFDEIETPSSYPVKISPIFDQPNPIVEFFRQHSDLPNINLIFSWGMRFLFSSTFYSDKNDNEMQSFNSIKELIDPNENYFFDVKAELRKQNQTNNNENDNNNNNNNDNNSNNNDNNNNNNDNNNNNNNDNNSNNNDNNDNNNDNNDNNNNNNSNSNNNDNNNETKNDNDSQITFDRFVKIDDGLSLIPILLVRYSLTNFFNIQIALPITAPNANFYDNFYNNVILKCKDKNNNNSDNKDGTESNENIKVDSEAGQAPSEQEILAISQNIIKLSQTFLYVSADKIAFPPKLFVSRFVPPDFITLSFLSNTIDDSNLDIQKIYENEPSSRNSILFLFSNLKTADEIDKFTEYLNSKQFTDGWISEARGCFFGLESIDKLFNDSLAGDANAAKMLLDHPECRDSLAPSRSILHRILHVLLANEAVPLPTEYKKLPKPPQETETKTKTEAETQTETATTTNTNDQANNNAPNNAATNDQANNDASNNAATNDQANNDASNNAATNDQANNDASNNAATNDQANNDASNNASTNDQANNDASNNAATNDQANNDASNNASTNDQANNNASNDATNNGQANNDASNNATTNDASNNGGSNDASNGGDALSNVDAAIIYKAIQFKKKLEFKPLIKALHEYLIDVIDSITKKRGLTDLVLAGFKPNDESEIQVIMLFIPHDAKDLIVDLTNEPLSMIFLNVYMLLYYVEITHQDDIFDAESLQYISDFCSNFFYATLIDNVVKKSLPPSFHAVVQQRRLSHIKDALKDKALRQQALDLILPTIKKQSSVEIVNLAQFFIDEKDVESIMTILSSEPPSVREIVALIPLDVQERIFDELIEKGDQSKMKMIVPLLLEMNPSLFKKLGAIAMKTPRLLDSLLSVYNCSNEAFIETVSSFSGEITTEFAQMLKKLVHSLPIYLISREADENQSQSQSQNQRMSVKWSDEAVESSNKVETVDPWNYDEEKIEEIKEHNSGNHQCFNCYTCGIFGDKNHICLNCALKCHRGHDITYYGLSNTPCVCGKKSGCKCKIDQASKGESESEKSEVSKPQKPPVVVKRTSSKSAVKYFDARNEHNVSLLMSMFRSLMNSKLMKPPDPLEVNRLTTGSIFDVDITKFHSSFTPSRLKFATVQPNPNENAGARAGGGNDNGSDSLPVSLLPKLIDIQTIINEVQNQSSTYERHFEYRNMAFPLFTAGVGGPLCNILVVANGRTLTSFNIETMQQLSTYRMAHPGFQIAFCPLDPSVFAIASLKHVMIFSITEDGTFQESDQIMLLLEELGPNIFVNSVVWVPLEALHLAVVCNSFIKIYDIPTDRFSPIACFFADSPNFFSSAVFVEHDEECYGLFALSTGRIAIQNTNVDPSDGPIPLTRFAPFPRFTNHQLTLSYCQDSDLLFISSPPQPLLAMRLDEIFKEKEPQFLSIDVQPNLVGVHLYFIHCVNGNLHFFVHPNSGAVFTIEFIDNEQVEVSSLSPNAPITIGGIPLYDRSVVTLTTFVMQDKLYAIGKNGKILALQSADESNDDDDEEVEKENDEEADEEDEEANNNNNNSGGVVEKFGSSKFIVPASFWSVSKIASKFAIEISAHAIQSDPSVLLSGGGFVFPGEIRHKYLDVSIKDDNLLIVGFKVTLGIGNSSQRNRPSYIKIFGRKYATSGSSFSSPLGVCIPLKQEEVRLRRRYRIGIGNNENNEGNDIFIDGLDVFTIRVDQLDEKYGWMKRSKEVDWFKDGENVFDFCDSRQIVKRSKIVSLNGGGENQGRFRNPRVFKKKIKLGNDVMSYMINNISLAFPLEVDLDDNAIVELVGIMYGNPDISIAARRMIIKGAKLFSNDQKRKNEVLKIWAETISNLVKEGKINDKQWGLIWRDLALMPQDLKDSITPIVWKSNPQLSGTFTALTAFLTQ